MTLFIEDRPFVVGEQIQINGVIYLICISKGSEMDPEQTHEIKIIKNINEEGIVNANTEELQMIFDYISTKRRYVED